MSFRPSTDRAKRARRYLRAAEALELREACGCCAALYNNGGKSELEPFKAVFEPASYPDPYWMGLCKCHTDENIPFRVLAMCFMAAMVERGDA
jgi:hypothetical protein